METNIVEEIVKENEAIYGKIVSCCDLHESFCRCGNLQINGEPRIPYTKTVCFGGPSSGKPNIEMIGFSGPYGDYTVDQNPDYINGVSGYHPIQQAKTNYSTVKWKITVDQNPDYINGVSGYVEGIKSFWDKLKFWKKWPK